MKPQVVVLFLTAFSGFVNEGFGQDIVGTAFEVDKGETSPCNSDVGKDCAGFKYCEKKSDAILEQCVQCANEKAATFGLQTTRADCSKCVEDLTSSDPTRREGAIDFESGFQRQMSDLDVECSDSMLSNFRGNSDRAGPKGGNSTKEDPIEVTSTGGMPDFADSTGPCACQGPCEWNGILTGSICGIAGMSCQVSMACTKNSFTDPTVNYIAPPVPTYLCC